jgi:hypothetical protein
MGPLLSTVLTGLVTSDETGLWCVTKGQGDEMLQNELVIVLNVSFMRAYIGMSAGCI